MQVHILCLCSFKACPFSSITGTSLSKLIKLRGKTVYLIVCTKVLCWLAPLSVCSRRCCTLAFLLVLCWGVSSCPVPSCGGGVCSLGPIPSIRCLSRWGSIPLSCLSRCKRLLALALVTFRRELSLESGLQFLAQQFFKLKGCLGLTPLATKLVCLSRQTCV